MKRSSITIAAVAFVLSGCTDGAMNPLAETALIAVTGVPGPPLTRAQVDASPYASLAGKIGKGPRSLLILAEAEAGDLIYAAADRSLLVFRDGRLVRTVGLARNLQRTAVTGGAPALADILSKAGQPQRVSRTIDLEPLQRYDLPLVCTLATQGRQAIEILGRRFDTTLVIEQCACDAIDWSFENRYWLDDGGFAWKSVQHFYPGTPPVEIEILKPPAPPA